MRRRTFIVASAALAVSAAGGAYLAFRPRTTPFVLISPEDVARARPAKTTRAVQPLVQDGPEIVFHSPNRSSLNSPVDFDVEFRPRGGVAPQLGSLRVDYDLGITWLNVTRTLLAHARVSGNRLLAANAELPKGNHTLRLSILDVQGRQSRAVVRFEVS